MKRLTKAAAWACALAVGASTALGSACAAASAAGRRALPDLAGQAVYTVLSTDGTPGDLYLLPAASVESSADSSAADAVETSEFSATSAASVPDAAPAPAPAARVVEAGKLSLPWIVHVGFSLDGPDVSRSQVTDASGLVGIHVRIAPRRTDIVGTGRAASTTASTESATADTGTSPAAIPRAAYAQHMRVAFTIPANVAGDVSASDGAIVTTTASATTVLADLGPGEQLDCYMNAHGFTMGPIIVASAGSAPALADGATRLVNAVSASGPGNSNASGAPGSSATSSPSGAHARLISDLTDLRNLERSLAAQEIPERTTQYNQAFDAYMAAYVTSYVSHLSGSIGSSTQLTALMGTAGELSGDTPVARAVMNQAGAVDAMNAARRHTGAANALDDLIRRIRQQGTDGLKQELRSRAGEERTQGAKDYAAGQSQLSQAMIPYSMAYTDAFTRQLSGLTGGSSQASAAQVSEAVAATNREFAAGGDHAGDRAKVQTALDAMAAASERTGAGQAYRQVLLRFADALDDSDASGTADGGSGVTDGTVRPAGSARGSGASGLATGSDSSLAAHAETVRLRAQARAERRAAHAANGGGDATKVTVVDEAEGRSDASDIMKFAGGVPGAGGAKSDTAAKKMKQKNDASSAGSAAAGASGPSSGSSGLSGSSGSDGSSRAAAFVEHPSPSYGIAGMGDRTLLHADMTRVIADTTALADGGTRLQQALGSAQSGAGGRRDVSAADDASNTLRVFLVFPGL